MAEMRAQSSLYAVGHAISSFCQKQIFIVTEINDRAWVDCRRKAEGAWWDKLAIHAPPSNGRFITKTRHPVFARWSCNATATGR